MGVRHQLHHGWRWPGCLVSGPRSSTRHSSDHLQKFCCTLQDIKHFALLLAVLVEFPGHRHPWTCTNCDSLSLPSVVA
jgi:hypothetical protein